MKNKSKKKKIQAKKPAMPNVPKEWLYLSDQDLTPADIAAAANEIEEYEIHVWVELGIIEIPLPCGKSIDLEWGEPDLGEEEGNQFLAERNTKSVYFVTIVPESYEEAKMAMKCFMKKLGGGFYGDTQDFQPQVLL